MAVQVGDPASMFRVRIVRDSVQAGRPHHRVRSYQLTYPRILLAELNTHRQLARSTESSRAQPPEARLAQVRGKPYRPLRWGQRIKGMGAGADLEEAAAEKASAAWDDAIYYALLCGEALATAGLAKEEVNRVVEPFSLCRTVVTSSQWDNFFALRTHETAHPAFTLLARAMYVAGRRSMPVPLQPGEWHLPYITSGDVEVARGYVAFAGAANDAGLRQPFTYGRLGSWADYHLCRWSAARCARVSYNILGRANAAPTPADDDKTWAQLTGMAEAENPAAWAWQNPAALSPGEWPYRPIHASPMEHQCTPPAENADLRWSGNLTGWVQFRKLLGGECVLRFEPPQEVVREWEGAIPEEVFTGPELY